MLNINYTGTSSVTVLLYENCKNKIDPFFTWQLVREGSWNNIIFYTDDVSRSPNIYNKFILTIGSTSNGLTQGIIPVQSGQYDYTIYEMVDQYDIDLNNNIGVVQIGTLNVIQDPILQPLPVYTGTSSIISNIYFQPSTGAIPVYRGFTPSWS